MANARFETTFSFARHRANCRIVCRACGHERVVTAPELTRVFPTPMPIAMAERRLLCTKCGKRGARMVPIPEPTR